MALSLEHFKLLTPKVNRYSPGTGGVPDITWQEVCDLLATLDAPSRIFARWRYGFDSSIRVRLVELLTINSLRKDSDNRKRFFENRLMAYRFAELGLLMHEKSAYLTKKQKAQIAGVRHWSRKHEEKLRNVGSFLDELDFNVIDSVRKWNRQAREEGG
jgi:hypothetical protein